VISKGTRVAIIAVAAHGRKLAAAILGTDVFGTRVLIITDHRFPDAGSCLTVVGHGASVPIGAVARIKDGIDAPLFAGAFVFGALVSVIAKIDEIPVHKVGLIAVTIAIIIEAIA
jgi:hypothetical protein